MNSIHSFGILALLCLTVPSLAVPATAQASQNPANSSVEAISRSCVDAFYAATSPASSLNSSGQQLSTAIATCQQAVHLTQTAGDQRLEAYSRGNLGSLYLQQQNQPEAVQQFEQVLSIAQQSADSTLEIKALIALGTAQAQQPQTALDFYQQALLVAEAASDPNGIAIALYNAGLMYDVLGQYQQSVAAYSRAESTATASGDVILAAYATQKLHLANQAIVEVGAAL